MKFDPDRVRRNVQQASTEDLLDRATVYRQGMEPEAVEMVADELARRGVSKDQIELHSRTRDTVIMLSDGTAQPCSFCRRPAISQGWGWHRLWGKIPLFPRFYSLCQEHQQDG